jgi:hypothetical protein
VLLSILLQIPALPEDKQRALKHVSLTCSRLLPIAKEALLREPCVRFHRIQDLVDKYKKHPNLRPKVTTLEFRADNQDGCTCTYQSGIIAASTLQIFSFLVALLPNINTLLLGANQLKDIKALHFLFMDRGETFCSHHGFTKPFYTWYFNPSPITDLPSPSFPDIAHRITTLELPAVWTQQWNKDHYENYRVPRIWALHGFTSLKHLTMPHYALYGVPLPDDKTYHSSLPETLRTLTISNVDGYRLHHVLWYLNRIIERCRKARELDSIDIWCHDCCAPQKYPAVEHIYEETQIRVFKDSISKYVADVGIHYDACHSDWICETALARERKGRPVGELEYFGRESRGLFERFRGEVERRVAQAKKQIEDIEEAEDRIFEARKKMSSAEREWLETREIIQEELAKAMRTYADRKRALEEEDRDMEAHICSSSSLATPHNARGQPYTLHYISLAERCAAILREEALRAWRRQREEDEEILAEMKTHLHDIMWKYIDFLAQGYQSVQVAESAKADMSELESNGDCVTDEGASDEEGSDEEASDEEASNAEISEVEATGAETSEAEESEAETSEADSRGTRSETEDTNDEDPGTPSVWVPYPNMHGVSLLPEDGRQSS